MRNYVLMFAAITMLLACNSETKLTKQCEKQLNSMYEALRDNDPTSFFKTESKYYAWYNSLSSDEQSLIAEVEAEWTHSGSAGGYFEGMGMSGGADAQMIRFICDFAPDETSAAIQKLEDIMELQLAYKGVYGHYADTFDILRDFYNNGFIIDYNTQVRVPVKEKLFTGRRDFGISSIEYIPTNNLNKIEMRSFTQNIWGVQVPVFEAYISWRSLLTEYDKDIVESVVRVMDKAGCYPGLMVGNINNRIAGNWE